MTSRTDDLKKALSEIILNADEDEGVVVSLQGPWGIGKTYFWNQFAANINKPKKHVYISLFGKHKLDDIKKEVVLNVYNGNKLEGFLKNSPIIGQLVEHKLGIDYTLLTSFLSKEDFKNVIICFDDFERLSPNLSMSEVLGLISELKEQNKCKIVLINNKNSLKELDDLNHQKVIKHQNDAEQANSDKRNTKVSQLYKVINSNNQEVFNAYSEKIVDYTLKYEPHYSDSLKLVKCQSLNDEVWSCFEELLSHVSDREKQNNLRLIKRVVQDLLLIDKYIRLNSSYIGLVRAIVTFSFNRTFGSNRITDAQHKVVALRSLETYFESILSYSKIDKNSLNKELLSYKKQVDENKEYTELKKAIFNIYDEYLYSIELKDDEFAKRMSETLLHNKEQLHLFINVDSFMWFYQLVNKIADGGSEGINETEYLDVLKRYIKEYYDDDRFRHFELNKVLEVDECLESYYNKIVSEGRSKKVGNAEEVIEFINNVRTNAGWNKNDEYVLSQINIDQHKDWILNKENYLKQSFKFSNWANGFSGNRPFDGFITNFITALEELINEKSGVSYKLDLMLKQLSR